MSALIPRFLRTMSFTVCGLIASDFAKRYPLISIGRRNSSWRISPGWIAHAAGVRRTSAMSLPSNQCCILVVVRDFDLVRVTVIPHKADPKLVVDSNCVLFPALAFETRSEERRVGEEYRDGGFLFP